MSDIRTIMREDTAMRQWHAAVSETAAIYERRWTLAALKRVAPDLHVRLIEQRNLFDKALVTGTAADIDLHGAAMVRGWQKALAAVERAGEPDDAYVLGQDPRTGFRVAIGQQKRAAARVRELHGQTVVWVTPDEVAALMAGVEVFKPIAEIKKLWPGAEIVELRCDGSALGVS
jgi:hypothetical protein